MSAVDTAQLDLMFTELRLPTFKAAWAELAERADADGWPAARLLAALAEQEIADRARAALRTPARRGPTAARQNARQLRLQCRAPGLQGACQRPGRRRPLARPRAPT